MLREGPLECGWISSNKVNGNLNETLQCTIEWALSSLLMSDILVPSLRKAIWQYTSRHIKAFWPFNLANSLPKNNPTCFHGKQTLTPKKGTENYETPRRKQKCRSLQPLPRQWSLRYDTKQACSRSKNSDIELQQNLKFLCIEGHYEKVKATQRTGIWSFFIFLYISGKEFLSRIWKNSYNLTIERKITQF